MLFHSGSIFDGEELLPMEWAVLVEGDRIAALGPLAGFDGYAGARTDISGQTLLPGLIDCHAHLTLSGDMDGFVGSLTRFSRSGLTLRALENAQSCLRGGVTAMRDCGGVDHVELAVRDACNSGRFIGPTIRVAGRCICMTGGTNFVVARVADGPAAIVTAVREEVQAGCDCIKLMAHRWCAQSRHGRGREQSPRACRQAFCSQHQERAQDSGQAARGHRPGSG